MRRLLVLVLFALFCAGVYAAVPSYEAFVGSNGITVYKFPPTGKIIIDGAGVTGSGGSGSVQVWTNQLGEAFLVGDTNLIRISSNNASLTIGRHASEGGISPAFSLVAVKSVLLGDTPENGFVVSSIDNNAYNYWSEIYSLVKADPVNPIGYLFMDLQKNGGAINAFRIVLTPGSEELGISVSGNSIFHVNSVGHIDTIAGLTGYTWPLTHVGGFLKNDGAGNLSWYSASDLIWTNDAGVIHPSVLSNRIAIGSATIPASGFLANSLFFITNNTTNVQAPIRIDNSVNGSAFAGSVYVTSREGPSFSSTYSVTLQGENKLPSTGTTKAAYENDGAFGGFFRVSNQTGSDGQGVGVYGQATGTFFRNHGAVGAAFGSRTNVGVFGTAGTGTLNVGGYFETASSSSPPDPPLADSVAIIAENRGTGNALFVALSNSVPAFKVDGNGDLTLIRQVPYLWPNANASGFLQNDGAGVLSWAAAAGGDSVWTNDLGIVHLNTITNRIAIGTNGIPDASLLYISYDVTNPPTYLYHIEDYVSGNTYLTAAWAHTLENTGLGYTKNYSLTALWENDLPPNGGMDAMYSNLGAFGGYFATSFVDPLTARTNGEAVAVLGDTRGYYSSQYGVVGMAQGRVGVTQTNVGVAGTSIKQTGNRSVGAYFEVHNTPLGTPSFDESVLLLDNRAQAVPLIIARSNTVQAFKVDAKGDITLIKQIAYVWPTAQGGGNTFLKNDGSGGLSWSAVSLDDKVDELNGVATNLNVYGSSSTSVPLIVNSSSATNAITVKDANGNIVGRATTNGFWQSTNDFYVTLNTTGTSSGQTNNIFTFTMRTNSTVRVIADVAGFNPTNRCSYGKLVTFGDNGGTVTQIGALAQVGNAEDLTLDECLIDVSANTIRVRVAGASNSVMDWTAAIKLIYAAPYQ